MTAVRGRLAWAIGVVACVLAPVAAPGQTAPEEAESTGRKSGTYVKLGLAHWQGDIFSESSLTQWNVDLFGAEYNLTSLGVEVEAYFRRAFLVSGFSIGYRKDAIRSRDAGHMLSATLFRDLDLKVLAIKAGGGAEWGVPSLNFDRTEFEFASDGTVRYRHTYPGRNAHVPVGARSNGALYPFVVLSAVQRPGPVLIEIGMRINLIQFHFDDYEVRPGDQVTRAFDERRVMVPYLFVNVGVRLF
ncbi:MAG: hypothetical protein AB1806_15720 [Acidobacteriota bacterium]